MKYIKDIVIPNTNKCLKSTMVIGEYFRVIDFWITMSCYIGHSIRDFFLMDTIIPKKAPPPASIK